MQHPFLIVRFIVLALLVNLNLLVLVFAAWNANATLAIGLSISVTAIFLLLNSCLTFVFIISALAELVVPGIITSRVLFECCWSAVLSLLQSGTAISITVHGADICRETSDWSLCSSTSLLLPATWLSTVILFTHFLTLFITAATHTYVEPGIWHKTVHSVNWFRQPEVLHEKSQRDSELGLDQDSEDAEASQKRDHDCEKAPWARNSNIRRGVDIPFKSQTLPLNERVSSTTVTRAPNVQAKSNGGSRFTEQFRESQTVTRLETPIQYYFGQDLFPSKIDDHDLPIPLPRLSEWIRADAAKGISVHTVPRTP